jgi:hypothetical protein
MFIHYAHNLQVLWLLHTGLVIRDVRNL